MTSPALSSGLFITFEGIDGAGKSTHIQPLADALCAAGNEVVLTREPGGTPLAESLRALLLSQPMDALTESLLVFAARRDHLQRVIEPALAAGKVVLCDRFTDATFAYQGAGRGFDMAQLRQLEAWVQALPGGNHDQATAKEPAGVGLRQPDFTLWFDLPPVMAAQRVAKARDADRFEAESQAFFERVSKGYAMRMQENPARFLRVNSDASLEQVRAQVFQLLKGKGVLP
jgi:dTMP kinase